MISRAIKHLPSVAAAIILALSPIAIGGCDSGGSPDGGGSVSLSQNGEVTVETAGGSKAIIVTATSDWDVSVTENENDWLSCKKTSATLLSLSANANTLKQPRSAKVKVYLTDNSDAKEITVIQPSQVQTITLSPGSLNGVPSAGQTYNITVTKTADVNVTYKLKDAGDADWIIPGNAIAGNTLSVKIEANTDVSRSGSIVFSDSNGAADDVLLDIMQYGTDYDINDPTTYGYTLQSEMQATQALSGLGYDDKVWSSVNSYMQTNGWDYTEHPNNATGDHGSETHVEVVLDNDLQQYVFNLMSHSHKGGVDGDRGPAVGGDRMRNEMKSRTGSSGVYKMNGSYGDWQVLEWKMKIPVGYRPSTSFCHIHQLKGVGAYDDKDTNIGSPVITLTLRANGNDPSKSGYARRLEVIHDGRSSSTKQGTVVADYNKYALEKFEGKWLQVQQEANYKRNGYYRVRITEVSTGTVLLEYENTDIDLWRIKGCTEVRNKFGIYRSYGMSSNNKLGEGELPPNGIEDENIWLADFKAYKKGGNTHSPGTPFED